MPIRTIAGLLVLAALGWWIWLRIDEESRNVVAARSADRPAPVEVAAVERGRIVDRRVFSGTLEARAEFIVAPKVTGRIDSLHVDLGDEVLPGTVVAELDDDEFQQAVFESEAELQVTTAQIAVSETALEVATREYDRIRELQQSRIASGSELDVADADLRARRAEVDVAKARLERARATLEAARVRLGYAQVLASWDGDEHPRLVAERWVDPGATVAANDPIVTLVDVSKVRAVLFATERDFARLSIGQAATIRNDAYPGRTFTGRVLRVAPVFEQASRQTRVEVEIPNPDRALRPGMFVRIEIDLGSADDAIIVPEAALVRRDAGEGVFVVAPSGDTVRFVTVERGILAGDRVQILGDGIGDRVVTLGQQLLSDGSAIRVPEPIAPAAPTTGTTER